MKQYNQGDLVHATGAFTDPNNGDAYIDPTVVKLSIKDPSGNVTTSIYLGAGTPTIVRDAAGRYSAAIDADEAGVFYYRWWSTGTGQAAEEKSFQVTAPQAV